MKKTKFFTNFQNITKWNRTDIWSRFMISRRTEAYFIASAICITGASYNIYVFLGGYVNENITNFIIDQY